jgi:hypothetical protein
MTPADRRLLSTTDLGDYETSLRRLAKMPAETVHGGHFPQLRAQAAG